MPRIYRNGHSDDKHPATGDRDYSDDDREFLAAIEAYQRRTGTKFPPWSDVLKVLLSLGYRKGEPPPPAEEAAAEAPKRQRGATDDQRARVLELVAAGMSQRAVSTQLGISDWVTNQVVKEAGGVAALGVRLKIDLVRPRVEALAGGGLTLDEVAAATGCDRSMAWRILREMRARADRMTADGRADGGG